MKLNLTALSVLAVIACSWHQSVAVLPSPPETATLTPVAWGMLADGGGNPIDGMVDYSEINQRVLAGYSWTLPEVFRGIFEFNRGGYSHPSVNAVLRLQVYESNSGFAAAEAIPFQLFGYSGNGLVTAADFSAGTLLSSFTISSTGARDVNVSSFVSAAFTQGNQFIGFNLRPAGNPDENYTSFFFGTPVDGPAASTLILTAVPEPSTAAMIGMAGLLLRRRCNRRRLGQSGN